MTTLWNRYVLRRGTEAQDMWDLMFKVRTKPVRLLYIGGRGFDLRAQVVMDKFLASIKTSGCKLEKAELLLVQVMGYNLTEELKKLTESNAEALKSKFEKVGSSKTLFVDTSMEGEDDITVNNALRHGTAQVLREISDQTDILLDVSSMPRIAYLSIMLGILEYIVICANSKDLSLSSRGINFQVLVGEDATLDSQIRSDDPSNELVLIPGYGSAMHTESTQDWPLVWFPVLGEYKVAQFEKVMMSGIPSSAEICPVLPHPSRDPRRGDKLLLEYKRPLFDERETPLANVLYAHESNPFETYRQLLGAMHRYQKCLSVLGGCRLVVTPLASKLITLGAALACFEMKLNNDGSYGIAIPYAEPKRYDISLDKLEESKPDISAMVLTGDAYEERL